MNFKKWWFILSIIGVISILLFQYKKPIYRWFYNLNKYDASMVYKSDHIKKYAIHGIDVSHHQGIIEWDNIEHPDSTMQIDFVFIRAVVGTELDNRFKENWSGATKSQIKKGAYHYYWSNVNSAKQAAVFIDQVVLHKGDLPPVLDIEDISNVQNKASLRKGLKNWIKIIKDHYGVQPIIYSGEAFYRDVLMPDSYFEEYPRIWIANYNRINAPRIEWDFWQYSDRFPVDGIKTLVDGNVFQGSQHDFEALLVP